MKTLVSHERSLKSIDQPMKHSSPHYLVELNQVSEIKCLQVQTFCLTAPPGSDMVYTIHIYDL